MDESDHQISQSDQFEQNFSRLDLTRTVPYHQSYHYQSFQPIPVAPTAPPHNLAQAQLFGQAPLLRSNSIPSNLQISDHINDIINRNESIVGRRNSQQSNQRSAQVRKRSIRGPWRYEERILQLGYKPSHQQRRNSLPVQALTTQQPRDLQRPYQQKQKFKRRASLPVIQATSEMSEPGTSSSVIRGLGETPTRVSVIIDNPAYRPSGPSSNADVQSRHNSISETNLIPKEQKSRSWNDLHDPTNQQADQNGNDSDGSELIIVDDPPEFDDHNISEYNIPAAALLKKSNPETEFSRLSSDEESEEIIRSESSHRPSSSSVIRGTILNEQRPSGIVIGEPIGSSIGGRSRPYPRDESGPGIHSPILTKKVKTEYGEVPKTEVPKNVISAVEEVKRKAKLSAVPANSRENSNVAVVNPFRNETRPQILSVPTEGGTPNAVIQNPIRSIINPSSNNQSQAILDRYDIEGRPFGKGEVDSDEEDSRPFKCHECQKGFRISGHLARHNKAEIHMKRLQELRELGIQPTTPKMSVIQQQSPITTTITDSQAPLPVISDRTVSSTTVDVPPRSHTPESEEGEGEMGARKFPCLTCNVAFRFQGHLDRHYRSTMHQSMVEAMEGRVSSSIRGDGARLIVDMPLRDPPSSHHF